LFDDNKWNWDGADIGVRVGTAEIDIKYGWDYDERFGQGKISEHFVFNRRFYESHRTLVANYLAVKYGIDLGTLKRYTNWEKKYDVAGIGQHQFYDKHLDAQGTGIVRMTATSGADDGEYLMWGHDNEDLSWTMDGFPILSERLERTWGVEETGDMGTVLFQVAEADIPANAGIIGLIVGDDQDFEPAMSLDFYPFELSEGIYTAMVDFPEDGVFTIGVEPSISVDELTEASVSVYPNPARDSFTVEINGSSNDVLTLELIDALGRTVKKEITSKRIHSIDVSDLAKGKYELRISDDKNSVTTSVVVW
jgi:hypothetical protein